MKLVDMVVLGTIANKSVRVQVSLYLCLESIWVVPLRVLSGTIVDEIPRKAGQIWHPMKKIKKDYKNRQLYRKYEKELKVLKALVRNELLPLDARLKIQDEISKNIPRNASRVRQRNYCLETGRARGVITDFGISRIVMKNKAELARIPGVKRSS